MSGSRAEVAKILYWEYQNHISPTDALRSMREKGYTVDEVRSAIRYLVEHNTISYEDSCAIQGALNMISFPARTNPGPVDDTPMMFKHFEDNMNEVRERIRARYMGLPRMNPQNKSPSERAAEALFQPKSYQSSIVQSMDGGSGRRDVANYNPITHESEYRLWDHTIAEVTRGNFANPKDWKLEFTDAGWPTPTTHGRLNLIVGAAKKAHPELVKENIYFHRVKGETVAMRNGKIWKKDPKTGMWTLKLKPIPHWDEVPATTDEVKELVPKRDRLTTIQGEIDVIEDQMAAWQIQNDPARHLEYPDVADRIGKRAELSKLLRERMKLMERKERTNPERVYWRD